MKKGIKILLFFYLISRISFGQLQNIKFEHITTEYGLANNEVSSIIQDSSGFMWFGTNKGLNRWDGYSIKYFGKSDTGGQGLSSDTIHCIQLIDGKLWLGTESGVNIFDPVTERFAYIQHNPKNKNSLSNNFITSICKDSYRNIWIGTADGLNEFNPATNKFKHFRNIPGDSNSLSNNFVSAIYQDSHKILWIGAGNYTIYAGGLNRFDYKSETFKVYYFHYEYVNTPNWIRCFCQVKPNQLWIGTFGGIRVYDYSSESFIKHYCDNSKYENNWIFDIIKDKNGKVWVGSWGGGIKIFNKKKEQFVSYLNDPGNYNSLNEDRVMSIYEDNSRSIWIGTMGGGVNKVLPFSLAADLFRFNGSNAIQAVLEDLNGNLWIGAVNDLYLQKKTKSNYISVFSYNGIAKPQVYNIAEDEKKRVIWVGTKTGLLAFDYKANNITNKLLLKQNDNDLSAKRVFTLYVEDNGDLWVGTENGVDKVLPNGISEHHYYIPKINSRFDSAMVTDIYKDSFGILWAGTPDGLLKFNKSEKKYVRYRNHPGDTNSISGNNINMIYETKSRELWIATNKGLNKYQRNTNSFKRINKISSTPISGILEDNERNLWLAFQDKICRFNPGKKEINYYGSNDGLQNNAFNQESAFRGRNGVLYFGGAKGLTVIHPEEIIDNLNNPNIVLTRIKIFEEDFRSDTGISYLKTLKLSHYENSITFEFAALDYTSPAKNQYAYKLEGFHDGWTYTDANHRLAFYTNLDPGKYTFKVIGSNCDGVWNKAGTSINIIILPPWWATWWFRAVAIIFFLSGLIFLYKLRVNHLKLEKIRHEEFSKKLIESQEGERKRIAGELHDSLGQNLMIIYNEIQQFFQKNKSVPKDLENLAPDVKETIEEVREIARNLHPYQIDQLGLTKAVKSIIKKLSNSTKINFDSNIEFIDNLLPSEQWIHIYRIVQEALTNIIKHSGATEVIIELKKEGENIFMLIKDNGVGIKSIFEKTKNGFGLENLKERARLLDAKLEISSSNLQGVKVEITIPVKTI